MINLLKNLRDKASGGDGAGFSKLFKKVPVDLVKKVNGNTTEQGFLYIGSQIAEGIESELRAVAQARGGGADLLRGSRRILDFGSGLGRVLLQLRERVPGAEIVGFDIDPLMNQWAEHLLTGKNIRLVSSTLDFPDGGFDFISAISVFTHLDKTTDFWLGEIHRLLSPTGLAFITYQDDTLFEEMKRKGEFPEKAKLDEKYVFGAASTEGGAGMGTFYTTPGWERRLQRFFNVEVLKPRGLFQHQSISIVSRKDVQVDLLPDCRAYVASLEADIYQLRRRYKVAY